MGTRSSGRRGSKNGRIHEILMERLKSAGTAGVLVEDLKIELNLKSRWHVFYCLNVLDPVTEETVIELRQNPKTGKVLRKKMTRLYYCGKELYESIEKPKTGGSPRGAVLL